MPLPNIRIARPASAGSRPATRAGPGFSPSIAEAISDAQTGMVSQAIVASAAASTTKPRMPPAARVESTGNSSSSSFIAGQFSPQPKVVARSSASPAGSAPRRGCPVNA